MFTRVEKARKYNGVFESPRPLNIALVALNPNRNTRPDRKIRIY